MPYIKLLTALAGLALLTACGGAATPANTGDTGGGSTADCTQTPFHDDCLTNNAPALLLRQTMCLADSTTDDSCGAVIEGVCMDDPFNSNATCMTDTYLSARIAECIKGGMGDDDKCTTITTDTEKNTMVTSCLTNPFDIVCQTSVTDFAIHTATARMNRLTFCNDGGNVANDFCTGNNLVIICSVDPFNAICFTGTTYATPRQEACLMDIDEDPSCVGEMGLATLFCKADPFSTETACTADTYLPLRVADCIEDDNAGETRCDTLISDSAMNTMITDCLENPFATACESVSAFSSSFALARMNRLEFCNDNMNVANGLCMGASLMGICGSDPFHAICLTGGTYIVPRQTACLALITADPTCSAVLAVNHADFKAYYADSARTAERTLHATPTGADLAAFVEGTATSLPTDGLTFTGTGRFAPITVKLGGVIEGESGFADIDDGFAIMYGHVDSSDRYRAGLLSGTDLGPAVPTTGTATWTGEFYVTNSSITTLSSADLSLAVDFTAGTIGTTSDITPIANGSHRAEVKGLFGAGLPAGTPAGILGGTVIYKPAPSVTPIILPLIGLIGTEGVIGIFHGGSSGNATLAGGFYAEPPAPTN